MHRAGRPVARRTVAKKGAANGRSSKPAPLKSARVRHPNPKVKPKGQNRSAARCRMASLACVCRVKSKAKFNINAMGCRTLHEFCEGCGFLQPIRGSLTGLKATTHQCSHSEISNS